MPGLAPGIFVLSAVDNIVIARSASDEAIHRSACVARWIASRSLSSGAHSRDPLARNDGEEPRNTIFTILIDGLFTICIRRAFTKLRGATGEIDAIA